jgi:DNA-binding NarL/FixJ family response regulator
MNVVSAGEVVPGRSYPVARTFSELLKSVKNQVVDVMLLPDTFDTTTWIGDQVQAIRSAAPLTDVIVFGNRNEGALIFELLEAGARGYLFTEDSPLEHLDAALRAIRNGKIYLSPTANAEYLKATQSGCWECWLTPQTRTVLRLIAEGKTVAAIADVMHLKVWTVYKLLKRIRQRFDVNTNAAAIGQAMAQGYLSFDTERAL